MSVDQFRAFTEDGWLLGRVATLHAFGDVLAMGGAPEAALLAVQLPAMSEPLSERTLGDVMLGAESALDAIGAVLVGGHSAEGSESVVGVTALGRLAEGGAIGLDGARPGDALWLTRPLGSGALLAGAMRRRAKGRDLAALYESLATPQSAEAAALRGAGARAMTDVTGFGLAGHLLGLLEASRLGAEIDLGALPAYAGAVDLLAEGVRSSIDPANRRAAAPQVSAPDADPRAGLLYDPQTAGGLLAALPAGANPGVGVRIGALCEGAPRLRVAPER